MEIPQKIENRTTYNLAISLLGIYLKKMKTLILKDMCRLSRPVRRRRFGWSRACGRLAFNGWGAGQERAAALSLVRLAPRPGRVRGSRSLNAWKAAAWSGLHHVVGERWMLEA